MTRTPVALLVLSSIRISETTESGRTVRLPLSRAGKISAAGEWNAAFRSQPRPQRPRPMHRDAVLVAQHAVGGHTGATRNQLAPHLRDGALHLHLAAIELQRPLEDAVGQVRNVLLRARDAEQRVHLVVVGRDVGIADRPVLAEPVVALRLQIQLREAQRHAAPEIGLAAEHAGADPRVRRAGDRVLLLVGDPVAREVIARVGHHLLVLLHLGREPVRPVEGAVLGRRERELVHRQPMAPHVLVRPLHRLVLLLRVEHAPGLEQEHLDARHRQLERGHAAGSAGADDDGVVGLASGSERSGGLGLHHSAFGWAFWPQWGQSLPSSVRQPTNSGRYWLPLYCRSFWMPISDV